MNNFAVVNQKFGYHKGDEFLYVIARWLDECVPNGRAFRFGNVTFAVLCPYISDEKSSDLVNKIVERFEEPWKLGEIQYTISACYGAMSCRKDKWDSTQIIEILAFMMEIAKTKEGGRVEFDAQIEHMFLQKKNLLILLRDSIEKKRFEVWYQPVIDCKTHEFVSAEALLRLRDYKGNMVSPAEFIPVAEENGMIEEIGWIVWDEVCQFLAKYRDLSLKYISLNMSVQQFMNPELFKMISDRLEKNNLDASKIKLEITERVVLADEVRMQRLMNEFSSKGLKFAMDDFGTGYSNFASVMHLPFEMIKLDRSLLREMHNNIKDMHVVKSMIELFHSMGFQVVSEGVETEEQQRLLMEMGTNYIQGFYYARPMPKEKLVEFLKEG